MVSEKEIFIKRYSYGLQGKKKAPQRRQTYCDAHKKLKNTFKIPQREVVVNARRDESLRFN